MKKRVKEILIITSLCCMTLFVTTGCGLCYSCGSSATKGCLNGCVNCADGCATCANCLGCNSFCAGCMGGCL